MQCIINLNFEGVHIVFVIPCVIFPKKGCVQDRDAFLSSNVGGVMTSCGLYHCENKYKIYIFVASEPRLW